MRPAGDVATTIEHYSAAWNRHDVDAILALHTEDAVFENHTSGGQAVGKAELRQLLEGVFATFPDLRFATRRAYFTESVAVLEWTAHATHTRPVTRGKRIFAPTGKALAWNGMDVLSRIEGRAYSMTPPKCRRKCSGIALSPTAFRKRSCGMALR